MNACKSKFYEHLQRVEPRISFYPRKLDTSRLHDQRRTLSHVSTSFCDTKTNSLENIEALISDIRIELLARA